MSFRDSIKEIKSHYQTVKCRSLKLYVVYCKTLVLISETMNRTTQKHKDDR